MNKHYDTILDIYPIISTFPPEASFLSLRIEQEAFKHLEEKENKLLLCLCLARDLGYLDERLFYFLEKKINRRSQKKV